jgi:hypothetical protein
VANRQQTGVFFLVARQGVKVTVSPHRHAPQTVYGMHG